MALTGIEFSIVRRRLMRKITPTKMMLIGMAFLTVGFLFEEGFFIRKLFHLAATGVIIVASNWAIWFGGRNDADENADQ